MADVIDIHAQDANVDGGGVAGQRPRTINGETGDMLDLSKADGCNAADTSALSGYSIYAAHGAHIALDTHVAVTVS